MRVVDISQPLKDLSSALLSAKVRLLLFLYTTLYADLNERLQAGTDDRRLVSQLADLLDKCLGLDPSKRMTVTEALKHAFFSK